MHTLYLPQVILTTIFLQNSGSWVGHKIGVGACNNDFCGHELLWEDTKILGETPLGLEGRASPYPPSGYARA